MNNKLKMIDLCAGTGAFSHVFTKNDNIECVFANDMYNASEEIYNANHINKLINKDLLSIDTKDIPRHDILCAGFPCQPFSLAGEKKGFDDDRSNIFWKIIDIIKKNKPRFVILENVKNLQTHDNKNTFTTIINSLSNEKYYIKYKVLNTSIITGVPQNRERIYILCFKNKKDHDNFDFDFPKLENNNITDFLENNISDKYYYTDRYKVYDTILENVTKHISENVIYQYRRSFVRENKNNVCPTLTANMGTGGHNVPLIKDDTGIRKLIPKECFNLQGFPLDYIIPNNINDNMLYKLAGNAVSIPVVELIANKIFKLID